MKERYVWLKGGLLPLLRSMSVKCIKPSEANRWHIAYKLRHSRSYCGCSAMKLPSDLGSNPYLPPLAVETWKKRSRSVARLGFMLMDYTRLPELGLGLSALRSHSELGWVGSAVPRKSRRLGLLLSSFVIFCSLF